MYAQMHECEMKHRTDVYYLSYVYLKWNMFVGFMRRNGESGSTNE